MHTRAMSSSEDSECPGAAQAEQPLFVSSTAPRRPHRRTRADTTSTIRALQEAAAAATTTLTLQGAIQVSSDVTEAELEEMVCHIIARAALHE